MRKTTRPVPLGPACPLGPHRNMAAKAAPGPRHRLAALRPGAAPQHRRRPRPSRGTVWTPSSLGPRRNIGEGRAPATALSGRPLAWGRTATSAKAAPQPRHRLDTLQLEAAPEHRRGRSGDWPPSGRPPRRPRRAERSPVAVTGFFDSQGGPTGTTRTSGPPGPARGIPHHSDPTARKLGFG